MDIRSNKSDKIEDLIEKSLLYDFYGELLNDHQRQIYEAAIFDDLSLAEVASEYGISRQGVHDLLKRCNKIMEEYEEKLMLVAKFRSIRDKVEEIQRIGNDLLSTEQEQNKKVGKEIIELSEEIFKEL